MRQDLGMITLFVIIPGIIAALILSRWLRTIALAALIVWGYICFAHAQQSSPMVQCHMGAINEVVPDYACDALGKGYRELRFAGDPEAGRMSMMRCASTIGSYVHVGSEKFIEACTHMWQTEMYARARDRALGGR